MESIAKIEIYLPIGVEIEVPLMEDLHNVIEKILKANCPKDKVMWVSGEGFNLFDYPLTAEEEKNWEPRPTDWTVLQIQCSIKDRR